MIAATAVSAGALRTNARCAANRSLATTLAPRVTCLPASPAQAPLAPTSLALKSASS